MVLGGEKRFILNMNPSPQSIYALTIKLSIGKKMTAKDYS